MGPIFLTIPQFVANAGISPSGPKNITKSMYQRTHFDDDMRTYSTIVVSLEEWDFINNINTRGTFITYRAAAQQMIKQGTGGRIMGKYAKISTHYTRIQPVVPCLKNFQVHRPSEADKVHTTFLSG